MLMQKNWQQSTFVEYAIEHHGAPLYATTKCHLYLQGKVVTLKYKNRLRRANSLLKLRTAVEEKMDGQPISEAQNQVGR